MSYSEEDLAKLEFWPANLPKTIKDDRPAEKVANEPAARPTWPSKYQFRNTPNPYTSALQGNSGMANQCDPRQTYLYEYANQLGQSMAGAKTKELQELYNLYGKQMEKMEQMCYGHTPYVAGGPLGHSCRTPEKKPAIETLLTKKPKKKGFFQAVLETLWK